MDGIKISKMGCFYVYFTCQDVIFKEINNKYLYKNFYQKTCYFMQKGYNKI